jgi:DNA-binding beta-propeller fold protein YncE
MAKINSDPLRWRLPEAALVAVFFLVSCGNRATPAPKPQPPPPFEFLSAWGDKGQGPGQLDAPVSFVADSLGNIFFADPTAGFVHKFESKGTPLQSFEDSRLRHAAGIAVDSGGAIYVADAQRGAIHVFFPDGTFFQSWRTPAQRNFSGALGFGIDEEGALYAPDPANSRVLKFNNHGRLVKSWPAPQKAMSADERPSWVSAEPDNSVFVAYFSTGRIEKFSADGSEVTSWQAANTPSGESSPIAGFAVSAEFVFTMAASSSEIRVWTIDGQHKLDADLGASLGKIAAPQIAVTPHAELLVFDPSVPKVFRFRLHLENKDPL